MAFRGEQSSGGEDGLEDLTKAIIEDVLRMPGNEICCDCGAAGLCRQRHLLHSAESTLTLSRGKEAAFYSDRFALDVLFKAKSHCYCLTARSLLVLCLNSKCPPAALSKQVLTSAR